MAKNFANQYARTGSSIALEQSFFAVEEVTKGTFAAPTNTDFFLTMAGGSITHTQPVTPTPHRTGRHNTDTFLEKKSTEWEIPTFVNIDTTAPGGDTSTDAAIRLLWKALLGSETINAGVSAIYNSSVDPDTSFSLYENGDKWAQQCRAAFVQQNAVSAPGDGQAQFTWSGMAADRLRVGIVKFTSDSNATNIITAVSASEAKRMPVGAQVMIIENDGLVRSADTPDGTYRTVTARNTATGAITIDGAVLADADGTTGTGFYLAYAEPAAFTGISGVQTGLVGSIDIDNLGTPVDCVRSFNVNINNNHEAVSYCYGTDGLAAPYFIPGSRLSVEVDVEINLDDNLIEFLDDVDNIVASDIDFVIGAVASRHFKLDLPKTIFNIPSTSLPDEGSIPVSLNGVGFQTSLGAADELTASYL